MDTIYSINPSMVDRLENLGAEKVRILGSSWAVNGYKFRGEYFYVAPWDAEYNKYLCSTPLQYRRIMEAGPWV